ncbi:unnamed protein product [Clonostachys rosea]|uniref:Major facilitator superfamily (MFS) profile domain-containing protein n=1 Tax=Bionectria ochroleuca TaxID=29856 RepID=A0ABY6UNU8_BIOOC|nr:unnamed protein product [Clonostachys rosea]
MSDTKMNQKEILDPATGEVLVAGSEPYIDPDIENAAVKKFDRYVLPQILILVLLSYLDRSNIGNARVFGFEEGLHLQGIEFNNISTMFFVTYVTCEIPWVMAVKRWGANVVLALAVIAWSILTIGMGFVKNYHQAIALRLLLGAAEAGLYPGLVFLISTIYQRSQQAKRVSILPLSAAISGAFGGLIAYGIQSMGDKAGLSPWRWLFIIEGVVSVVIGGVALFTLPKTAESAWFLNEEEKAVMRAIKLREAAYKGPDKFEWKYMTMAFTDPFVYVAAILSLCGGITLFGFNTFLPTILKGLGYKGLEPNYYSIPCYVVGTLTLLLWTSLSDRLEKRALFLFIAPIPAIIGYSIVLGTSNGAVGYFAMFMCAAGIYPCNALIITWVNNNLAPDHKRSIGMPLFLSISNISGIVSSQIYPGWDGPRYIIGNSCSVAAACSISMLTVVVWFLLRRRDQKKEKMIAEGVAENGYEGEDRGLNFRYKL